MGIGYPFFGGRPTGAVVARHRDDRNSFPVVDVRIWSGASCIDDFNSFKVLMELRNGFFIGGLGFFHLFR